ncbi:hypothetical protein BHE74_00014856 [Ensete ventricosum]|nr:hypothetical protein BHE74_00014856 [Ensete ventricosum]
MVFVHAKATQGGGSGGREAAASSVLFFPHDLPGLSSMALPGAAGLLTPAAAAAEDPNKKVRKPYTITKSRESWTEQEHDKFLEALQLFDRDWKKIEAFVGSKSVIQIRSHAQKYFLKVQKTGTSEHVPPPRPKRKASHPYPQKAPKNGEACSCLSFAGGAGPSGALVVNNCCSSSTISRTTWPNCDLADQENHVTALRVMPDFAQVYSFLGSVFDPSTTGHLQRLKEMDPIDVETVLLLMRNLSINLNSPDFEAHLVNLNMFTFTQRRVLSSYNDDIEEDEKSGIANNMSSTSETVAPFV